MKSSKIFVGAFLGISLISVIGLTYLFIFSSRDLAAKACFQIAHQLQQNYQKDHQHFAADLKELDQFDMTCIERFAMKVDYSNDKQMLIVGSYGTKNFSIDENRQWRTY